VPTDQTRSLAIGDRALWSLPSNLKLPEGFRLAPDGSPDGPPDPSFVQSFLQQALAGPTVKVPADPTRYELDVGQVIDRLRSASGAQRNEQYAPAPGTYLDYVHDIGGSIRVIVLDIVRRGGGSGGLVRAGQTAWLQQQLATAAKRWVIVVSHQPLPGAAGGEQLLAVLDRAPRVIAALSGHTHQNRITPRTTAAGGYWLINTASLIDYPQQSRALRVVEAANGGVAIHTWMLDHVGDGRLGGFSRELSYLNVRGGRPLGFSGTRADRNAILFRRRPT
jgi:hypothetical protein